MLVSYNRKDIKCFKFEGEKNFVFWVFTSVGWSVYITFIILNENISDLDNSKTNYVYREKWMVPCQLHSFCFEEDLCKNKNYFLIKIGTEQNYT